MDRKMVWIISVALVLLLALGGVCAWQLQQSRIDRSGWSEIDGNICYNDFHGEPLVSWQKIEGKKYYFGTDGAMATHWRDIDGQRYYFGTDGVMVTHWQTIDGSTYYFGDDGAMATAWQSVDGSRHYFNENGQMLRHWQDIDENRYYFSDSGAMVTGEVTIAGKLYYFLPEGPMVTGWHDGRCYLPEGGFAQGWQEIDGKRYCFDQEGHIRTGWIEEGEDRFYLLSDGSAAVGPVEIDGKLWHFSPRGKQIYLVNGKNHISEDYEVELTVVDGARVSEVMAEALTQMMADARAEGVHPVIVSSYRTYWDQKYLYNDLIRRTGETGKLYSAEPNASEHQLGLAVDIVEYSYRTMNASQENTGTFKWFSEHCWEYGFIVRYLNGTTDITGIAYEPWHYRYVGVEAAMELKELGITLEEYLGAA